MFHFRCDHCGKEFSVGDELAGRRAVCKACNAPLVVPAADAAPGEPLTAEIVGPAAAAPAPARRLPVRVRRLYADAEQMRRAFADSPLIHVQSTEGDPPERYRVAYFVRGLVRDADGKPVYRDEHLVEIQLTRDYPRQSPKCKMLTPVFHPNVEPSMICIGDHWTAGERLVELVIRIGEMLAYQAYNIQSPLDGEAAMWADRNTHHLPTDNRDLWPPGLE